MSVIAVRRHVRAVPGDAGLPHVAGCPTRTPQRPAGVLIGGVAGFASVGSDTCVRRILG